MLTQALSMLRPALPVEWVTTNTATPSPRWGPPWVMLSFVWTNTRSPQKWVEVSLCAITVAAGWCSSMRTCKAAGLLMDPKVLDMSNCVIAIRGWSCMVPGTSSDNCQKPSRVPMPYWIVCMRSLIACCKHVVMVELATLWNAVRTAIGCSPHLHSELRGWFCSRSRDAKWG